MKGDVLMALGRHDSGQFAETCDELLAAVVKDITRFGGTGKVVIEIVVQPNGEEALSVTCTAKNTLPKRKQGTAFYYPTKDGGITRTPPQQEALGLLRSVDKEN